MCTASKKRNWSFLIYLDSAPTDWLERLKLSGLMFAVSPYHDKDFNADGSYKKPHHHIIIVFSGPTTYKNVCSFIEQFKSPIPLALESVKGMYRYFTHLDNPEKFQYDSKDIICGNGFDISSLCELTSLEIQQIIINIQTFIRENEILEYSDLLDYLLDFKLETEYNVASKHTILFNSYLCSRRNKLKNMKE